MLSEAEALRREWRRSIWSPSRLAGTKPLLFPADESKPWPIGSVEVAPAEPKGFPRASFLPPDSPDEALPTWLDQPISAALLGLAVVGVCGSPSPPLPAPTPPPAISDSSLALSITILSLFWLSIGGRTDSTPSWPESGSSLTTTTAGTALARLELVDASEFERDLAGGCRGVRMVVMLAEAGLAASSRSTTCRSSASCA